MELKDLRIDTKETTPEERAYLIQRLKDLGETISSDLNIQFFINSNPSTIEPTIRVFYKDGWDRTSFDPNISYSEFIAKYTPEPLPNLY